MVFQQLTVNLQRNQDFPEEEVHYLGNSAWWFFSNMTESSGTAVSSLNKTFSVYHCVPSCRNSFIGIIISNWGRVIHYSMFKMRKINNGYTSFYPPYDPIFGCKASGLANSLHSIISACNRASTLFHPHFAALHGLAAFLPYPLRL